MKSRSVLVSVVCTAALMASFALGSGIPYELSLPQNSDFQDLTLESFKSRVGVDSALLSSSRCDGVQEFQLFTETSQPNPEKNSFRVSSDGESDTAVLVYRVGSFFDRAGKSAKPRGAFLKSVARLLAKMEKTPSGAQLIRKMEESPHVVTVLNGRPQFAATIPGMKRYSGMWRSQAIMALATLRAPDYASHPLSGIGSGGALLVEPSAANPVSVESDGSARPVPDYIIFAHEMYHAYDSVRGLLDRRFVDSRYIQSTEVTEIRASYFENVVRKEAGLRYKKYYSREVSGPGLLDSNGNPILIPAPCWK